MPTAVLVTLLVAAWLAMFLARLFGPSTILDDDQQRPAAYVLDLMVNGHVLVQYDDTGDIMSKPPFYTWLVARTAIAFGELNEFTLYLPGALAVLGMALIIFLHGRAEFGPFAAFLGAAAMLLSNPGLKQVHLARTDAVFSILVYASAVLALEASRGRCSWYWFWMAGALATLTKGPLGLLLAAGGFLASWITTNPTPRDRSPLAGHVVGMLFFFLLTFGWFCAAYMRAGEPLIEKLIGKELLGHATESARGDMIGSKMHQPPIYFLSRFAPWSLFCLLAIRHFWKQRRAPSPAVYTGVFLSCYFLFGLLIFSLSPHQRFDHQFPLIPAAALLAGVEVARLLGERRFSLAVKLFPLVAALAIGGAATFYRMNPAKEEIRSDLLKTVAAEIKAKGGNDFPLQHADATMGLQFFLGTMRQRITTEEACNALKSREPAYIAVRREGAREDIEKCLDGTHVYTLGSWTPEGEKDPFITILSNRAEYRNE